MGGVEAGRGLALINSVVRMLWDGSTPCWHEGDNVERALESIGFNVDQLFDEMSWTTAKAVLDRNVDDMYAAGHWGLPLMVFEGEPFYGQDRFDYLLWRMKSKGVVL